MAKFIPGLNILKVVGGEPIQDAVAKVQSAPQHIVVGTPGRAQHMLSKNVIDATKLKIFILDEADEMLSQGFQDKIVEINDYVPTTAQTVLLSATMPKEILDITKSILHNPVQILVPREELTLDGLKQFYIAVEKEENKFETLTELYESISVSQCDIFCNSKQKVIQLQEDLQRQNHTVSAIHGSMEQSERNKIMNDFRDGRSRILITTNLLSRGIDVQQVSLVINYDLPTQKEAYIHRIGRSARFGRKGIAINFVTDDDAEMLKEIQTFYSTQINELPSNIKQLLM